MEKTIGFRVDVVASAPGLTWSIPSVWIGSPAHQIPVAGTVIVSWIAVAIVSMVFLIIANHCPAVITAICCPATGASFTDGSDSGEALV